MAVNQKFSISLNNVTYNMTLVWCTPANCWIMSIADANGNPLVSSQPLVTGLDLLGQLQYLGFHGHMVVQSDNDPDLVPSYATLGSTGHLYWIPDPP